MNFFNFFTQDRLLDITHAIGFVMIGYFISTKIKLFIKKQLKKRLSAHQNMLISRLVSYAVMILFIMMSLQQLGFHLQLLLGAAGLFTVALSFASQTAASNLVSGIFLLFEAPFKVGDTVEVKGFTGVVKDIDLISTKLKTADGKLVRIANEAIMKAEIVNLNTYPEKRVECIVPVPVDTPSTLAFDTLSEKANALSLKDKPAIVTFMDKNEHFKCFKVQLWVNNGESQQTVLKLMQELFDTFV
jgi:small conductance mechanosensitive channel